MPLIGGKLLGGLLGGLFEGRLLDGGLDGVSVLFGLLGGLEIGVVDGPDPGIEFPLPSPPTATF